MSCYQQLNTVQKPYQYVGFEENTYKKDFGESRATLAIAFPDAYEIGMSNTGMQIIYHVVNEEEGLLADRVYAPLRDMGAMLRKTGQPLKARESGRGLSEFDCVGFTLQYELCYTNVLYMLDLAQIPRYASQRGEHDPLVMAGGPCVFNPEPIADFFDFFVIGEGEEVAVEVMRTIETFKARSAGSTSARPARQELLRELANIKGIYVPSLFEPIYDDQGRGRFVELRRKKGAPKWVERRIIADLDAAKYPVKPVTPAIQPVHERISVEIQRGCTRSCRFCQAGYIYRPRRERNPNTVLDIIQKSVAATGNHDIGLLSLSSADYSHIHPVMKSLMDQYRKDYLSVSLPSTRLEALKEEYLDVLKEEKRSGFTIAPEAGTQRLRAVINKNFTEEEIVETARMLFRNGWQRIKMYFMIGQPTETDVDVIGIAKLANEVYRRCEDIPGRKQITVSVSNFVPKPHTPFQWHEQIDREEIYRKQKLIRDNIKYKPQINFRYHSADSSFAEGLVARADRRFSKLIERAYENGAIFDCWQDAFDLSIWQRSIDELKGETAIDFAAEGLRERDLDERLPWHRIYCGIHPKFFKNEYTKAVDGIATEDCSFAACHECGLCNDHTGVAPVVYKNSVPIAAQDKRDDFAAQATSVSESKFRFQYEKQDEGSLITVLDLQTLFVRAFSRAGIRVAYDDGIRSRPKISMGPALPIGISSTSELFDISLHTCLTPAEIVAKTRPHLPSHVRLMTAATLEPGADSITQTIRSVSFRIDLSQASADQIATIDGGIGHLSTVDRFLLKRERKTRRGKIKRSVIDLKSNIEALRRQDHTVEVTMSAPNGQCISPYIVVDALLGNESRQFPVHKTGFQSVTKSGSLI